MSNQDALKDCLSKVKDDKLDEYVKKLGMDLINPLTKDTAYDTYITKLRNLGYQPNEDLKTGITKTYEWFTQELVSAKSGMRL